MRENIPTLEYSREPTAFEIKQGYGARHYRDFAPFEYMKSDGTTKKRIKADDGLIYTRI